MPARLIDGKALAAQVKGDIRAQIDLMTAGGVRRPGLAVIMVGDNPASAVYAMSAVWPCGTGASPS